jgi:hypothetical protein
MRIGRLLLIASASAGACVAPPAWAQQPIPAVRPVVDMVLADEVELAVALGSQDVERLLRLGWSNRKATFEIVDPPISPNDPAAVALRAAHVACANAHSSLGMLADGLAQIVSTNAGGHNTQVDNDGSRFVLDNGYKRYFVQRERCAARSGLPLPVSPLKASLQDAVPAFVSVKTPRLEAALRGELTSGFSSLAEAERWAARALTDGEAEPLKRALLATAALLRFLHLRDDPDMPRRDYAVLKECRWAAGHVRMVFAAALEGMLRPAIRSSQIEQARQTIDDYRRSKADCARLLGLPREAAAIDAALERALLP